MEEIYELEGVVKSFSTRKGIEDLVIVVLDLDSGSTQKESAYQGTDDFDHLLVYDRLGSVLTNASGQFSLKFTNKDFQIGDRELRPDILLVVFAPEISGTIPSSGEMTNRLSFGKNILHVSAPIRLAAGKVEAYSILIKQESLNKFGLGLPAENSLPNIGAMERRMAEKQKHSEQLLKLKMADISFRLKQHETLKEAAKNLFGPLILSKLPASVRSKNTYFAPGDNLFDLKDRIILDKIINFYNTTEDTKFQLKVPPAIAQNIGVINSDGMIQANIPSNNFWRWWVNKNDTVLERKPNVYASCLEEFREEDLEERVEVIELGGSTDEVDMSTSSLSINEQVDKLVGCATCPEEPLRYSQMIDPNYKQRDLKETINGLELNSGPTDVTSYYDFESIQIAFESIWTEVFDETLEDLGAQIYTEIVRTSEETDSDSCIGGVRAGTDMDPSSLKALLREYRLATGARKNARLDRLFQELETRLAEPYKFDVFAPNSVNFGVTFTYRQKWEPGSYQVGKLVKTIPLAPKEVRKYQTKVSKKLTKSQQVVEDREFKGSSESSNTSRAESEIVNRATNKTAFQTNMQGQLDMQMYNMSFGTNTNMESEKFSSSTKKNFREAVLKAAQEYRKQTKLEVNTGSEDLYESTNSGEIKNPNEEISVTYLFYELQRQFMISEELHRITPIITVAFEVPKPHEIDNDWLMTYSWIIRRVLLDEKFHAGLDYIDNSFVGSEIAMQEMGRALRKQQALVDELNRELTIKNDSVESIMGNITDLMIGDEILNTVKETGDFIHQLINPFAGMFGSDDAPDLEKYKEIMEMQLERSEKEQKRLQGRIQEAQSDLQNITAKFGEMSREYFDKQTAVAQLRIHIKENVLYYMQAIWSHEPKDQRYFRLYDLKVDWFDDPESPIPTDGLRPVLNEDTGEVEWIEGEVDLPLSDITRSERSLVDVADLDNLLGFKGNYAIFPVKEPNYIHLHMMKDYIDTQTGGLTDPDEFANVTTQELIDYLKCIRTKHPAAYESEKDHVIDLINERQQAPRKEKELVIVPSDSLYIECLPGKHAVLEDFKLIHRAIDVKKVQSDVRAMELENLRYAARLKNDDFSDPEIDKNIRIDGDVDGLDVEI
ncbi:MAG: hypothetical protein AB8B56_09890 [Crocinitomicaceae bacterium]